MDKAEYIDRNKALEILQKIEKKRRGCECSREAIRQANAIAYAREIVRQIEPACVIPFNFIREHNAEFLINDWRKENEQEKETEALQE